MLRSINQPGTVPNHPPSKASLLRLLIRTFRPRQWVKSGFILAPALFTLQILSPDALDTLLFGLAGFSLVASGLYVFNDLINISEDRQHPVKRFRPIASGELSIPSAIVASVAAVVVGTVLTRFGSFAAMRIAIFYIVLMICYTLVLRRLLLIDIITVAAGFVLRVLLGGALINEPVSHWLLLCTFSIALFLGLIKRRQERSALESAAEISGRSVLWNYPPLQVIDSWISALTAMTLICYGLYTVDPATIAKHHTSDLIYTLPFAIYGVFRYQKLAVGSPLGEDPTELVIKDVGLRVVVVLWAVTVGWILTVAK